MQPIMKDKRTVPGYTVLKLTQKTYNKNSHLLARLYIWFKEPLIMANYGKQHLQVFIKMAFSW